MERDIADYALEYARSKEIEYAEIRAQTEKKEELVLKNGTLEVYLSAVNCGFWQTAE